MFKVILNGVTIGTYENGFSAMEAFDCNAIYNGEGDHLELRHPDGEVLMSVDGYVGCCL